MSHEKMVIFFDFDGTIVDSMDLYLHYYNQYAKKNNKLIIDSKAYKLLRKKTYYEVKHYLGLSFWQVFYLNKKIKKQIYSTPSQVPVASGMLEILQSVLLLPVKVYIVSSNNKKYIREFLGCHQIEKQITIISASRYFPKTYLLKKLLKNGYKSAYMVSDEYRDIISAKQLGIISIGVTWGANEFNNGTITPDFLINDAKEILTIIKAGLH